MTFLEFIRKHLIIAIIAIVGILIGLIMMDYGDTGSTFSRDYLIEINGTRYKQDDVAKQAWTTEHHLTRLSALSGIEKLQQELIKKSDTNNSGTIDTPQEQLDFEALYLKAMASHPYFKLQQVLSLWKQVGPFQQKNDMELNLGTARYLVREAGNKKGIIPSATQITEYIRSMNAFRGEDGSFSLERYKDYIGTNNGEVNTANERIFRDLVSDLIIWDTIRTYYTTGLGVNEAAEGKIQSFENQLIDGWSAYYDINEAPEAEEPKDEEVQAYHAQNRNKYLTGEQRTYAIIKIDTKDGMNSENFGYAAEELQEALAKSSAGDTKAVIQEAIRTSENNLPRDLHYTISQPATCASDAISDDLKLTVMDNKTEIELSKAVFSKNLKASGAARYSSYYMSPDGKAAYIIRIDSIATAVPQEYAQAREAALADLKAVKKEQLFSKTVDELNATVAAELAAGKDMKAAFEAAKAKCEKLNIEELNSTPISSLALMNIGSLTEDRSIISDRFVTVASKLRATPNGASALLSKTPTSACIIGITEHKTAQGSDLVDTRQMDAELHLQIMQDWMSSAYERYETKLPAKD